MLRTKLYVFVLFPLLVACQNDPNDVGFQIDGGNEKAIKIESIMIENIVLKSEDSLDVTFEVKNVEQEDICLVREIFDNEFSVFAELQMKLPNGKSVALSDNGLGLTNYDILKLETGVARSNTLTFKTQKKNHTIGQKSQEYRITVGGVYCSAMTDDYYPIDFILQSDWVEIKSSE